MYDPAIVQPMREELTRIGFAELTTEEEVDTTFAEKPKSMLLVVNSVCGCAAGAARPGAALSIEGEKTPEKLTTVFAGQDKEATNKARSYFSQVPPSSPAMALFKEGELVFVLERHQIEGKSAEQIAADLRNAYSEFL